ncbi:hypothetical protein EBZ37_02180, partial [bacterium]|nr:hypothetical protein [bacterium]
YFSNQNRKVLRETRARNGGIADLSRFQSPSLREEISADAPGLGQKQKSPLVKRLSPGTEAQRLDNLELAEGAENLLNTAESVHYSFYSRIYGSLAPVWQSFIRRARPTRALLPGNYTVVADLVLDTEGNLIGIEFHERSEISQFNEAVIASVGKVKKFPNPPKDLIAGKKEFRTLWSFTVNVGQNSLINVAPPQRIE